MDLLRWIFRVQHGHLDRRLASATTNRRRRVAIEFGMWRSGLIGGASGSMTGGKLKRREASGGTRSRGGNRSALGDQEAVSGDAECGVVMKASPSPAFKMPEPDLLLEFLIIALDAPTQLGEIDQTLEGYVVRQRREPTLGRLFLGLGPLDQPHSSPCRSSRWAARMRTRAKREDSRSALPSRQPIVRQARLGKPSASSLTETGRCVASRRVRVGGRPWPDHRLGASGCVPGAHTEVLDRMPAT